MTPLQSFGAAVRQERESQSMTVEALAGAIRTWKKRMEAIEAGRVDLKLSEAVHIMRVLNCAFTITPG